MLSVSSSSLPGRKSRYVFPIWRTRASPVWWQDMQMLSASQGESFAGLVIEPSGDPICAAATCD